LAPKLGAGQKQKPTDVDCPVVRSKAGDVALGDALEMGETAEGRFASLF
jgi:hypothetical protein